MRQTPIEFRDNGLSIEGIITLPQRSSPPFPAVIVCHTHPLFGGNMYRKLVKILSQALDEEAIATLRFNFQGAYHSRGILSSGPAEQQTLEIALNLLRNWQGVDRKRIGMAGCSFGASVILDGLSRYKAVKAIALISPPVSALRRSPIHKDRRPKLVLVGEPDRLVSLSQLTETIATFQPPAEFQIIPSANHGLADHESETATRVAHFFRRVLQ